MAGKALAGLSWLQELVSMEQCVDPGSATSTALQSGGEAEPVAFLWGL